MRGRVRHTAAVLAVAAAVVAASAGCGGKGTAASATSGPASGHGSGAAATTAPAPAAGDGAPLLRKAVAAMHAARFMTVETKGTSDGRPTHVTAHLTAAGACAATVQDGGPAAQVIATGGGSGSSGGFYVKAGAAYWQATSPVLVKVFAGHWAEMPQSGQGSGLEQYCDLAAVLSPLDTYAASAGTSKGAVTERGGQQVVPLTQKSPQGVVTRLYVAATGTPYVLAVENSEGTVTAMSFGGFDRDPHVVAPPAAEIVRFGPGAGS